jgi:hypothetical protein
MFEVAGYIDGVAYRIRHDPSDPIETIQGSDRVAAMLNVRAGTAYDATPTGPFMVLDPEDGATVLCALYTLTEVVEVTGDVPDIFASDEAPPGAIF